MDIISSPATRVTQIYQTQSRIAELNKKANIKTVQGQVDRVSISDKARQLGKARSLSDLIAREQARRAEVNSAEPVGNIIDE